MKKGHELSLRGCIGTFEPVPLVTGLGEYAMKSAFQDARFSPITQDEIPFLECGVSLLESFESIKDIYDWKVRIHLLGIPDSYFC